ncbi:MAG: tetratricopeptide repeat protein, partial [Candidatus Odinarchaeota archaeon]
EAISRIKIMVANVLSRQGKYNEALELYKQAKEMQEKLNLKSGVAVCLTAVGEIYLRTGDIKQAVTNFNGALSIETELENKWGLAILWKNLAGVYWLQNDIKEARENLSKSLLAFEDLLIKTTDYVEGLRLMINIDLEEGSYDRAEDNLKKLKVLADERRSSNQILDAKHAYEVSGLLECRGDHESAIDWLLKTYNMAYQLDLPDLKISCLLKLSKITIKLYERQSSGMNYQNGVNRAILYLNDVEKILHENSPVSTTRKDQEQDLLDRVTFYLEVIDKLTQEYDLPSLRVDVMVTRAMLFRTMNEFKKAEKLFKQAGKLSDKSGFVKRTMEIQALSRESRLQDKATKKSRMLELRQAKSYLDDVLRQISILRIDKNR